MTTTEIFVTTENKKNNFVEYDRGDTVVLEEFDNLSELQEYIELYIHADEESPELVFEFSKTDIDKRYKDYIHKNSIDDMLWNILDLD